MKFNYQTEKRRFDEKWKRLYEEYKEAGMTEKMIREMYALDWDEFKRERVFAKHNQYMEPYINESDEFAREEGQNTLLGKFMEHLTVRDVYFDKGFGWIEEIDSGPLCKALKSLSEDQLEILTEYVFRKNTQKEIAEKLGISQSALSQQMATIKKIIKK